MLEETQHNDFILQHGGNTAEIPMLNFKSSRLEENEPRKSQCKKKNLSNVGRHSQRIQNRKNLLASKVKGFSSGYKPAGDLHGSASWQ